MNWRTANRRRKLVHILAALNPCFRLTCQTPKVKKVEAGPDWSIYDPIDLMRPILQTILGGKRKPLEPFIWNHQNDQIPRTDHMMSEVKFVPTSFGVVLPPYPDRLPPIRRIVGFDMAVRDGVQVSTIVTGTVQDGVVRLDAKPFDLVQVSPPCQFVATPVSAPSEEPGDVCGRDGCTGVLEVENIGEGSCTCFVNPPCGYCMSTVAFCPVCKWEGELP